MFTVRLYKPTGAEIVFSCVSYARGPDYVNITRQRVDGTEYDSLFIVKGHPASKEGQPFASKIEVSNAANVVIDTVREVPDQTKAMIADAVQQARADGSLPNNILPMVPPTGSPSPRKRKTDKSKK